jgi:ribonuclease III
VADAPELGELEQLLGHAFADREVLEQALTHGSLRHEQMRRGAPAEFPIRDNERLEFFGDSVLGLVVSELLFHRYPELDEGGLTRLRAALVSRKHLGDVGGALGLPRFLRVDRSVERSGGSRRGVVVANAMEALIAALYLDGGMEAARSFVERQVAEPYLEALSAELSTRRSIGDWKTALQELLQARRLPHPEYVLQGESGPDHRKSFVVEVRFGPGGAQTARGEGTS